MNKKILTAMLAHLSYSPTPDLSSTFLKMGPVVMRMKQYMETSNIPEFERATHNMQYNPMARQTVVFDFIDDFKAHLKHRDMLNDIEDDPHNPSPIYKITKQMQKYLEEKAKKVNMEFPIHKGRKIFDELVEAIKRKWADILRGEKYIFLGTAMDLIDFSFIHSFKEIANLINFMPLAIYEASKSFPKQNFEKIFNLNNLLTVADIQEYITAINHEPWMIDISNQALEDAITLIYQVSIKCNSRDAIRVARTAHEIRSRYNVNPEHRIHDISLNDLLTQAWELKGEKAYALQDELDYDMEIAKAAHAIGNVEMRDKIMDEAWESIKNMSSDVIPCDILTTIGFYGKYRTITQTAHQIGNEELANIALREALREAYESAEYRNSYLSLAIIAHEIGNTGFANTLLEKAFNEVQYQSSYIHIGETALEIGNEEMASKSVAKLSNLKLIKLSQFIRSFTFKGFDRSHYIRLAILAHNTNHTEVAQESLNNALEMSDKINKFAVWIHVATLAHELGNANMAREAFEKAKGLDATDDNKEIIDFLSRYMKTSLIPDANAEVTQASLNPITRVMSLFYNIV